MTFLGIQGIERVIQGDHDARSMQVSQWAAVFLVAQAVGAALQDADLVEPLDEAERVTCPDFPDQF